MSISQQILNIRKEFPILHQKVRGVELVYLDNAATTQKPEAVIACIQEYYHQYNSNVHRGAHYLANLATARMEEAREMVKEFLGASSVEEIIYTQGTTDGINLVAYAWGNENIKEGDEILIATSEHHANIVPWQELCKRTKGVLKVIPLNPDGSWVSNYADWVSPKTKLVAVGWVSNATGVVHPVADMIQRAHAVGAKVLIDGAQAVSHFALDVQQLNCDWLVFSGHKLFGPTGVGVLYGKKSVLESMQVYRTGGEMIDRVSFSGTTFNQLPYKFEAGTPHIEGIIALSEAIRWYKNLGWNFIHEVEVMQKSAMQDVMESIPALQWIGQAENRVALYSFVHPEIHPGDIGALLDQQGIAVRTGHHCTQPLWESMKLSGSARASFAVYNSEEEIAYFKKALIKTLDMLL
ncbi:MAG: SufS family cysteine desulfurase [Bacteroidetes bacterium]|nr:SufS family cysteine desulfurase [Bacteroidota bacterium]